MKLKSDEQARLILAATIMGLMVILVVSAMYTPAALIVLEKFSPILMLVLGYYFGRKQR